MGSSLNSPRGERISLNTQALGLGGQSLKSSTMGATASVMKHVLASVRTVSWARIPRPWASLGHVRWAGRRPAPSATSDWSDPG